MHVPPGVVRSVVLALHCPGGTARAGLELLCDQAERSGLVLSPASRGPTWAAITGGVPTPTHQE